MKKATLIFISIFLATMQMLSVSAGYGQMAFCLSSHGITISNCSDQNSNFPSHTSKSDTSRSEHTHHHQNQPDEWSWFLQHKHDDADHYHWHITITLLSEDILRTPATALDLRTINTFASLVDLNPAASAIETAFHSGFKPISKSDVYPFLVVLRTIQLLN